NLCAPAGADGARCRPARKIGADRHRVVGQTHKAVLPCPLPTLFQTSVPSSSTSDSDPYVWSGRASQEIFMELAASGLASMYPALIGACTAPGHDGYQRTCDLISGQTSAGHSGHQCSHAPGRPVLHLV